MKLVDLHDTKRRRREEQAATFIGGMRDPLASIREVPAWEAVGARLAVLLNKVFDDLPDAQNTALVSKQELRMGVCNVTE